MGIVVGMDGNVLEGSVDTDVIEVRSELTRVRECGCGCIDYHLWEDGNVSCADCTKNPGEGVWAEVEEE